MKRRIHTFKSFLDEDRAQMELPFDDKHPIHDKPTHVHVLDALETMNTMRDPNNYYSKKNLKEAWDEAYPKALDVYCKNVESAAEGEDPDMDFIKKNWDNGEMWVDKVRTFVDNMKHGEKKVHGDYRDYLEAVETLGIGECLTKAGLDSLEDERRKSFDYSLHRNGIWNVVRKNYDGNDKGLIDVWRAVLIRKSDSAKDVYEDITQKFGGVGWYWSWKEDGAIVYHMAHKGGMHIKLHGKARVEDIDWVSTIYKASYALNNEDEISLIEKDGLVMIEDVTILNKIIRLETPAVVPTGKHVYHDKLDSTV